MTKNKFTPEQAVRILQEAEVGDKTVTQICREKGITKNTFYAWKAKYGGMDVAESKRLKELERENARLKISLWVKSYNEDRPHSSLNYLQPRTYKKEMG